MKHTKEPWYVIANPTWKNANYRIANNENEPWGSFGQIAYASEYNARRIVACVNACAGVEDEKLRTGYVKELEKENEWLKGIVHNLDHRLITNGE